MGVENRHGDIDHWGLESTYIEIGKLRSRNRMLLKFQQNFFWNFSIGSLIGPQWLFSDFCSLAAYLLSVMLISASLFL